MGAQARWITTEIVDEGEVAMPGEKIPPRAGASFGVGSLPHRDLDEAVDFAWRATSIPTIPSLPRRSPAEAMVAQALVGIPGVSAGQYAGISVDVAALDPDAPVETDLDADAFGAFSAFLSSVAARGAGATPLVKWQFIGPVTLGVALGRAGLAPDVAHRLALNAVRARISSLHAHVAAAFPVATQIVVLDEPSLATALEPGSALGGDDVVDLVSGALAAVPAPHMAGLHCCARLDWGAMLATGATLLSVPVPTSSDPEAMSEMLLAAARISDHLDQGGRIAWGAVRTDGPVPATPERPWKQLMESMCQLVRAGVDPHMLRRCSVATPACGLAAHSEPLAERVMSHVRAVGDRVAQQATASRLTLGS